jgi:hypothetical protein
MSSRPPAILTGVCTGNSLIFDEISRVTERVHRVMLESISAQIYDDQYSDTIVETYAEETW